ncbi:hypothetical protein G7Y89_g8352 [Cudoniella acicularis]|uniref:Uncharacterized protein n=1 Tax=Cudoniella acicularis TaxID=354080 RepID=A0A8H4RGS7_9HELO|nr:hypothetical protein G7Y89_g8352 [Cudoniella acicularis]
MATQTQDLQITNFSPPAPPTSSNLTLTLLPTANSAAAQEQKLFTPATSLALSLHNGSNEIYLDRLTYRDLEFRDDGTVVVRIEEAPSFAQTEGETSVKVYVWKGEKLLGEWEAGSY